jgi:hypothetical protein
MISLQGDVEAYRKVRHGVIMGLESCSVAVASGDVGHDQPAQKETK